jgi:hypothetical protein
MHQYILSLLAKVKWNRGEGNIRALEENGREGKLSGYGEFWKNRERLGGERGTV